MYWFRETFKLLFYLPTYQLQVSHCSTEDSSGKLLGSLKICENRKTFLLLILSFTVCIQTLVSCNKLSMSIERGLQILLLDRKLILLQKLHLTYFICKSKLKWPYKWCIVQSCSAGVNCLCVHSSRS